MHFQYDRQSGRKAWNRCFAMAAAFLYLAASSAAGGFPHDGPDGCVACHREPPPSVDTHDPRALEKAKLLVGDAVTLCTGCHPSAHRSDHRVGVKTSLNRHNLPLDSDGRITCAITCHRMHQPSGSPYRKGLLRMHPNDLCLSCHDR